jgi:hypothetical protein
MARKRKGGAKIPRMLVMTQTAAELLRHAEAVERIVSVASCLAMLLGRFETALSKLGAIADIVEGGDVLMQRRRRRQQAAAAQAGATEGE